MSSYPRAMQPISDARDHGRRRDSESMQSDYGEQSSLNLKRPSVDNGQNSSRKKSKVVTACTQCVKRKSRCELVTEAGCHRCVVLQTDCSLRGTVPVAGPSRSTAQSVAGDSPENLGSELNSRLERIEDRLDKMLVGRDHSYVQPGPERGEVIDWHTMAPDYNASGSLSSNAFKIMGRPRLRFEDPVASGIVSPIELKYIHEKFISICDDIFHVTQLGVSPACPPTDLFLKTCILYYIACVKDATFAMPKEQRHSIYALMDRQYVIMLRADPSKDLALGLLILTYSPVPQLEYNVIHADPFRAAVLAYHMAADLGLEESVTKLKALRVHEITWSLYEKLLRDLGLWFSIFHRYIWSKIVGSPNQDGSRGSVPLYLMVRYDAHYIQASSLFMHLWLESELLDCATAPVRSCGRVRVEEQFHQHLLDEYITDLERAQARIAETRRTISSTPNLRTSWYLIFETYHLAYALAMQGSVEARNMPSPLAAQLRFDALIRFGSKLIHHMGDYLWHIILTRPDLSTLPVYFSPPIYLGLATIQGWDMADKLFHPSRPGMPLSVEAICQVLQEDQVSSPHIIARIKRIPKYRLDTRQIPRPESMPTPEHGTGVHPGGSIPHQDMMNDLAPQYTQPFDPFGGDMSWLMDFETDWTALVNNNNNGRHGDY